MIRSKLVALCLLMPLTAAAATDSIQADIQAKLPKTVIKAVNASPIPDLYEVVLGNDQLLYFHTKTELMLFGEIYTLSGENLTATAKQALVAKSLSNHLSEALVIGPSDGVEMVEFTDPNCGYCAQLDRYLTSQSIPVKRLIFFETRGQSDSDQKAIHILCSDDKEKAFRAVYSTAPPENYLNCTEGAKQLASHASLSSSVGVNGTPTVFLDGKPLTGFRQSVIEDYLKKTSQRSAIHE